MFQVLKKYAFSLHDSQRTRYLLVYKFEPLYHQYVNSVLGSSSPAFCKCSQRQSKLNIIVIFFYRRSMVLCGHFSVLIQTILTAPNQHITAENCQRYMDYNCIRWRRVPSTKQSSLTLRSRQLRGQTNKVISINKHQFL